MQNVLAKRFINLILILNSEDTIRQAILQLSEIDLLCLKKTASTIPIGIDKITTFILQYGVIKSHSSSHIRVKLIIRKYEPPVGTYGPWSKLAGCRPRCACGVQQRGVHRLFTH